MALKTTRVTGPLSPPLGRAHNSTGPEWLRVAGSREPSAEMRDPEPNPGTDQSRYYGPCLYLGPGGQRCERPSREDGFCDRHAPEGSSGAWASPVRIAAAILLLLATIWPLLVRLLREISAWPR